MQMKNYQRALIRALDLHADQHRKTENKDQAAPKVPYITHLMTVSSYVLEFGGSEDQAIAALLHDSIEDQGDKITYADIEAEFGAKVCQIVRDCTDAEVTPKPPWRERKVAYIKHLAQVELDSMLVSACDKYHNAQCINRDIELSGDKVWKRFNASPDDILWYYQSLLGAFSRLHSPVVKVLKNEIDKMRTSVLSYNYRHAVYTFSAGEEHFQIKIDQVDKKLDQFLEKHHAKAAFFITAFNPYGIHTEPEINLEQNELLREDLQGLSKTFYSGKGGDEQGQYAGEESFMVLDLNIDEAYAIAKKYQQLAFVWIEINQKAEIRWVHY